jgi:hypothetical protein
MTLRPYRKPPVAFDVRLYTGRTTPDYLISIDGQTISANRNASIRRF